MGLLGWVLASLPRNISRHTSVPRLTMPRPMHGRIVALSALLLTMALTAAPAQADQTLAPGQPAAADGVVTSWQVQSPATQTARLRTLQPLAGGTATTATSESVTLAGGSAT